MPNMGKNTGRQECYSETIEQRQVKRAVSGKYGENHGDPVHSSPHQSSEIEIGDHALGPARASQCVLVKKDPLQVLMAG